MGKENNSVKIRFREGCERFGAPVKGTKHSAGYDVRAAIENDIILKKGAISKIPTGLFMEMPKNYECQVRSRSGLSISGIIVINAPGTIDSDYRDEIWIIMANLGQEDFVIQPGMRIAQFVFSKIDPVDLVVVEHEFEKTCRMGGLGSTGTK